MTGSPAGRDEPDYAPSASWRVLEERARLLQELRAIFAEHGFLEVETPLLSADTVIDRHLDPLPVTLFDDARRPGEGSSRWLQTSPEFGMKRLLAAGAPAIFQITRAFRGGEVGRWHNPEFTIVEWYRPGDTKREGMALLDLLGQRLLQRPPARCRSYAEAFREHAGVDPHSGSLPSLRAAAERAGTALPGDLRTRDDWLDLLFSMLVQPQLGNGRPEILFGFPVSQAALARLEEAGSGGSAGTTRVAARFEWFVDGMELANGYDELTDADELRRRNAQTNRAREADGKAALPESSRLLAAMEAGLPACTGVALGFDRLVAVATGAASLAEVMAFTIDRA